MGQVVPVVVLAPVEVVLVVVEVEVIMVVVVVVERTHSSVVEEAACVARRVPVTPGSASLHRSPRPPPPPIHTPRPVRMVVVVVEVAAVPGVVEEVVVVEV